MVLNTFLAFLLAISLYLEIIFTLKQDLNVYEVMKSKNLSQNYPKQKIQKIDYSEQNIVCGFESLKDIQFQNENEIFYAQLNAEQNNINNINSVCKLQKPFFDLERDLGVNIIEICQLNCQITIFKNNLIFLNLGDNNIGIQVNSFRITTSKNGSLDILKKSQQSFTESDDNFNDYFILENQKPSCNFILFLSKSNLYILGVFNSNKNENSNNNVNNSSNSNNDQNENLSGNDYLENMLYKIPLSNNNISDLNNKKIKQAIFYGNKLILAQGELGIKIYDIEIKQKKVVGLLNLHLGDFCQNYSENDKFIGDNSSELYYHKYSEGSDGEIDQICLQNIDIQEIFLELNFLLFFERKTCVMYQLDLNTFQLKQLYHLNLNAKSIQLLKMKNINHLFILQDYELDYKSGLIPEWEIQTNLPNLNSQLDTGNDQNKEDIVADDRYFTNQYLNEYFINFAEDSNFQVILNKNITLQSEVKDFMVRDRYVILQHENLISLYQIGISQSVSPLFKDFDTKGQKQIFESILQLEIYSMHYENLQKLSSSNDENQGYLFGAYDGENKSLDGKQDSYFSQNPEDYLDQTKVFDYIVIRRTQELVFYKKPSQTEYSLVCNTSNQQDATIIKFLIEFYSYNQEFQYIQENYPIRIEINKEIFESSEVALVVGLTIGFALITMMAIIFCVCFYKMKGAYDNKLQEVESCMGGISSSSNNILQIQKKKSVYNEKDINQFQDKNFEKLQDYNENIQIAEININ